MKARLARLKFLITAIVQFNKHDGMVMAGHLSFLSLLALFPFIIFLVSLAGFFGQSAAGATALENMFANMPEDVANILKDPIMQMVATTGKRILTISILGALWISATAVDAARLSVLRAFGSVTRRPYLRRRAEALLIVILSAGSILIGMSILVLGPMVWNLLISYSPIDADWNTAWNIVRFSVSISLVFGALCLIFFILKPRFLALRPPIIAGAFAVLLLWLLVGNSFSLYLKYFGNYDVTYGSLAGTVITLIFFYFLSAAFILGAEINAALYHERLTSTEKITASD